MSTEGGRGAESSVCSDNGKMQFMQRNKLQKHHFLYLRYSGWYFPSLLKEVNHEKHLLNISERGICLTILLPFIVSRIKQASSWKFCIIWEKQEKVLIIKNLDLLQLLRLYAFLLYWT